MGDLFHQTNANQTSSNQQIGISTRDVGGSVTTGAAGSVTTAPGAISVGSGANVKVESLDATALNAAAATINNALAANTDVAHTSLTGFQNALSAVAENQQATQAAVTGQQSSLLGQLGVNPSQILWIAIAVVGLVVVAGYIRMKK